VKHDLVIKRNVVKHCGKTLSDLIFKNFWFSIGVLWSLDALFKSLIMVNCSKNHQKSSKIFIL
jgi:hypothetical protein